MQQTLIIQPEQRCPADRNPTLVYLGRLTSQSSRDTMLQALDVIAEMLIGEQASAITLAQAWGKLRYQHTALLRAQLAQMYAPATANKMLSALRGILKEAWRLEYMTAEEYSRAVDIENIKSERLPAGRDIAPGEITALMVVCLRDDSAAGTRDAAIIGVLWSGLRRAEVVNLDWEDYNPENGNLIIRASKGDKDRSTYLDIGTMGAIEDWCDLRTSVGIAQRGALFMPVNKGGNIEIRRLSPAALHHMIKRRGKQAGLEDFTLHDFRRTFVGDLLDEGVDIATVANMAGHSSVDTTRRYDRRGERTKQAAARKRQLPTGK